MPVVQTIGLLGSALLIVGSFSPIVRIPFVGQINYINNSDGVVVLVCGIISLSLVLLKKYKPLVISGCISFSMVIFTYFSIQGRIKEIFSQMQQELSDNPFRGLAEGLMSSVQAEWGLAIVIIGAIMLVATPFIKETLGADIPPKV